jgi:hypothetical protein
MMPNHPEKGVGTDIGVKSCAASNCPSFGNRAASDGLRALAQNPQAFHLFRARNEKGTLARADS